MQTMNDRVVRAPFREAYDTKVASSGIIQNMSSVTSAQNNSGGEDTSFRDIENFSQESSTDLQDYRRNVRVGKKGGTEMPTATALVANAATMVDPPALVREESHSPPDCARDDDGGDDEEGLEEEEEEMVSLEEQRILLQRRLRDQQGHPGVGAPSTHIHRRTPGANAMHRSAFLRRTPGAAAIHCSVPSGAVGALGSALEEATPRRAAGAVGAGACDAVGGGVGVGGGAPALGFGLNLSTPVGQGVVSADEDDDTDAAAEPKPGRGARGGVTLTYSSDDASAGRGAVSAVADMPVASSTRADVGSRPSEQRPRPPLDPSIGRQSYVYTPAGVSLAKNPHLNVGQGAVSPGGLRDAFSPNTIRLTENLDHLLREEEDEDIRGKHAAVGAPPVTVEDWSEAYQFDHQDPLLKRRVSAMITFVPKAASKASGGKKSPSVATIRRGTGGRRGRASPRVSPRTQQHDGVSAGVPQPHARLPAASPTSSTRLLTRGSPDRLSVHRGNRDPATGGIVDTDEQPGPLNFDPSGGGAFAPPSKALGMSFHTPTPKKLQRGDGGGGEQRRQGGAGAGGHDYGHGGHGQGDVGVSQSYVGMSAHHGEGHNGISLAMTTPRGPNNAAHFFPQATSDHSAAAFAQQHGTPGQYHEERPYAPSPHHFDYMPHSYGGHPSRMASPMNVPPMGSPMTVPGGYPMEPLHGHSMEPMHAHAAALHHPGSHGHLLQHGMGLPPPQAPQQFAMGMEGQSHHAMHQPPPPMPPQIAAGHGLPSWSPPTVPPYNGAHCE